MRREALPWSAWVLAALAMAFAGSAMSADELPPVESVGGVNLPAVPGAVAGAAIEAAAAARESAGDAAEPVAGVNTADTNLTLNVIPGTTDLVRIAKGYLNRLVTPFDDPKLLTANPLEVKKEGASLYVTTSSERPVGIHILSNDPADTRSISLTLIPARIPPKTITLKWGKDPQAQSLPVSSARARRWEESAPYEEALSELVQTVARGEVPEGYALGPATGSLPCELPDVTYYAGQRLTGHHFSVFVLRATNTGHATIEILGHAGCNVPGIAAVAPWPVAYLDPGASTEVYVVVTNEGFEPPAHASLRPSLLVP